MPEDEEDDDKKSKSKKDDKKADKGKKDDKKGDKGKGGKDAKAKGGKDKGGKDKGDKDGKGKGGKDGKDKGGSKGGSVKATKSGSAEGIASKDKKEKDPTNKQAIMSPMQDWAKEPKPGPEKDKPTEKGGEKPAEKVGEKPAEKGGEKPAGGAKAGDQQPDDKAKFPGSPISPDGADKKSGGATPSASKEKAGKSEGAEKAEKSSIKSAASVEMTKTETSKTETSDKSSVPSDSKSEVSEVALELKKKSSVKAPKGDEQAASRTVVRSLTARGPVYAEHYYDDETDNDGSRNYIEIQMFGRRHSGGHVDQASQGGQAWNQCYYDTVPQPFYGAPATQRATVSYAGYGSDEGQVQAGSRWTSNQQFFSGPDPGGYSEQHANYGDLTVSVWQAPPQQQQSDFCRDVAIVPQTAHYTSSRELRGAARLDAARNSMIAQKLKEMQQGLAQPLPDDAVTTERVIYEVTRGRPGTPESSGAPPYRPSSGPLDLRGSQGASQFYGAPSVSQAVVRHEMRQSSATRLQTASPGLQMRANSNHGMICNVAPGPSAMRGSSHSFRGPAEAQPVSLRVSKSVGGVQPLQPQAADIIKQQASIIERQSNIIKQQSSIIDQQLNLVDAALRGGTSAGCGQQREAYHVTQEFPVPALLPGAQADGAYDNEMVVSAEFVETNRMSRNPWNRRQ